MVCLVFTEFELSRQAGDVLDSEPQRLDLGQGFSDRSHWWRQVRPEVMKSFGQISHPQLLPLACSLPFHAREFWPWPPGSLGQLDPVLLLGGDALVWEDLGYVLSRFTRVNCRGEAAGIYGRGWRQTAAGAVVARIWYRVALIQKVLTVKHKSAGVLELKRRAGGIHGCRVEKVSAEWGCGCW